MSSGKGENIKKKKHNVNSRRRGGEIWRFRDLLLWVMDVILCIKEKEDFPQKTIFMHT
jgi:hypothetical protein